jgi:hypothetical protein
MEVDMKKSLIILAVGLAIFVGSTISAHATQVSCTSGNVVALYTGGKYKAIVMENHDSSASVYISKVTPGSTTSGITLSTAGILLGSKMGYVSEDSDMAWYCISPSGTVIMGVEVTYR